MLQTQRPIAFAYGLGPNKTNTDRVNALGTSSSYN